MSYPHEPTVEARLLAPWEEAVGSVPREGDLPEVGAGHDVVCPQGGLPQPDNGVVAYARESLSKADHVMHSRPQIGDESPLRFGVGPNDAVDAGLVIDDRVVDDAGAVNAHGFLGAIRM